MSQALSMARGPGPLLSRRAKAAIVVQFLLQEGADVPLSTLPEELQAALTEQLGAMRYVDRDTLSEVMREFADDLSAIALRLPGNVGVALNALDGKVSPSLARRMRRETGVQSLGDPWDRIRALEVPRLETFALAESVEVAAVLISKLDVAKAAELLGTLPGDRARRITYAVSLTRNVTPEAVERIGHALVIQIDEEPPKAFDLPPDERVGAILNYSASETRDTMLDGLNADDEAFASAVRKAIFTFANIPARITPTDLPRIIRDVDGGTLTRALAGAVAEADAAAAEFILSNLSRRMADGLREEIAERGQVPVKEAETAMTEVVGVIRQLVSDGEITLKKVEAEEAAT